MTKRGFIRAQGVWRTVQEIDLLERADRANVAQKQWVQRLAKLRRQLDDPATTAPAAEEIRERTDAAAVTALTQALSREPAPQVRSLYMAALARIQTPDAVAALVVTAIDHPDPDTRATATEKLQMLGPRFAEPALVAGVAGPDNARINRAAWAIGALGLSGATEALVAALETEHIAASGDGRSDGQTSVTFTPSGGGLSLGGGPKRGKVRVRNEAALSALVKITGQDFQWDVPAWRNFLAHREQPADSDLRRDD